MLRRPQLVPALIILILALPDTTRAQSQQPPPSPAFVFESDNGDNRIQLGAIVQFDGRFTIDDPQRNVVDTFVVRRFRSITQGRVARYFDYYLNIDFAGGTVNIRDAYFDTRFSNAFRVRVGKAKVPFSYDRGILVANLTFVERGYTTTVAPDRDTGVQVMGDVAGNAVSYAVSLTNGVVDGGSSDVDSNENKDVAARVVVRPFARDPAHRLASLGVAVAANTGLQGIALPSFPSSGRQTFFSYAAATADGRRTRWSPQVFYYRGPFGGYGEYVHSRGGVRKGGVSAEVDHDAWQVAASWVLTGEPAGERNVRPTANFDPGAGRYGALQFAARYQMLRVSPNAVTLGFAAAGSSRTAEAWTIGANWYLSPFVKWNFNLERTAFGGSTDRPRHAENAVLVRAQLAF